MTSFILNYFSVQINGIKIITPFEQRRNNPCLFLLTFLNIYVSPRGSRDGPFHSSKCIVAYLQQWQRQFKMWPHRIKNRKYSHTKTAGDIFCRDATILISKKWECIVIQIRKLNHIEEVIYGIRKTMTSSWPSIFHCFYM